MGIPSASHSIHSTTASKRSTPPPRLYIYSDASHPQRLVDSNYLLVRSTSLRCPPQLPVSSSMAGCWDALTDRLPLAESAAQSLWRCANCSTPRPSADYEIRQGEPFGWSRLQGSSDRCAACRARMPCGSCGALLLAAPPMVPPRCPDCQRLAQSQHSSDMKGAASRSGV